MAIITYPLNNTEYTAEDAELYHATRTSGVFANDDFPITVSGGGNVVTIGEGIGWIRNSKFSGKVVANKAEMSLDLGLPHATYPRIDAVVLQFSANANASEIIVKNGTAQTNPTPPEVVRTESVYELHLYHVYREAGAASVTSSNVTDLRSDSAYCGIMSDDVTMLGDDYVRKDMVGVANGVAQLDGSGKVPEAQLPSMDYIPTSQKAAANGVASLGSDGKVPSGQLPSLDYIQTSQKGAAGGVATLGSSGKVPSSQLDLSISVTSTSTTTAANSAAVKTAYDKAVSAYNLANEKPGVSSGTPTLSAYGNSPAPTLTAGGWVRIGNLVVVDVEVLSNLSTSVSDKPTYYDFTMTGLPTGKSTEYITGMTYLDNLCSFVFNPSSGRVHINNDFTSSFLYGKCRITFSYIAS